LHPRGEFVAGDSRGELAAAGVFIQMPLTEFLQQRPCRSTGLSTNSAGGPVTNRLANAQQSSLKRVRQESGAPVVGAVLRHAARILDVTEPEDIPDS
jgi:hypothetical protein